MTPQISIVIPVYNAETTLRACLASIARNADVACEVIAVDDMSSDGSVAIIQEYSCRLIRLQTHVMAAACRNIGAAEASSRLLLFFDADQVMQANCLSQFVQAFESDPTVAAVVASFTAHTPAPGFFSQLKNLRHHYIHQRASKDGRTLASGFTAIRKEVFDSCGGFEEPFGPSSVEDIALGHKMAIQGYKICFRPDIQVIHLKPYSLRSLIRSDILDRAVPWAVLMCRDKYWHLDLNTGPAQIMSVCAAFLIIGSTLLTPSWMARSAVASVVIILTVNSVFLREAYIHFGATFAMKTAAFLPVMYLCHGCGFIGGIMLYMMGGRGPVGAAVGSQSAELSTQLKATSRTKSNTDGFRQRDI
jgi:GT2 family glycosyltransferase